MEDAGPCSLYLGVESQSPDTEDLSGEQTRHLPKHHTQTKSHSLEFILTEISGFQ